MLLKHRGPAQVVQRVGKGFAGHRGSLVGSGERITYHFPDAGGLIHDFSRIAFSLTPEREEIGAVR
jgi:hypothetical protein